MSDQRTSLHAILFLGIAALSLMSMMMCMSLTSLQQTSAGTRAKLAGAVLKEFQTYENAFAEFKDGDGFKVLHISYTTRTHKLPEQRDDEMRDLAQFLYSETLKYDDKELIETRRIDVTRTYVVGDGCFQSVDVQNFQLELPKREPKDKDKKDGRRRPPGPDGEGTPREGEEPPPKERGEETPPKDPDNPK
jgi:hypothetical protein